MEWVSHPLLKSQTLEKRDYQLDLFRLCLEEDLLIVLPTGLGKTAVALLLIAEMLYRYPDKKCVLLTPTRVLASQHEAFLSRMLDISSEDISVVTGEMKLNDRVLAWSKRVVCATPQIMAADLERGLIDPKQFSLIIFDEAHRSVGAYAYTLVSMKMGENPNVKRLGMTASLPAEKEKVEEILRNLKLNRVEAKREDSAQIARYVQKTSIEWIEVQLNPLLNRIRSELLEAIKDYVSRLAALGLGEIGVQPKMKHLIELRAKPEYSANPAARSALFSLIRLTMMLGLIETQTVASFTQFMERLLSRGKGIGLKELLQNEHLRTAYEIAKGTLELGVEHPKLEELIKVLKTLPPGEKAIVFTSYRASVQEIYKKLASERLRARILVGKRGSGGLTQKEQVAVLEEMRRGEFDILISTQVGEEGLDIAECRLVVFYDNVPSAIRFVQRRGRTGRRAPGRVVAFLVKGTRDEAYYWLAKKRLREAKQVIEELKVKKETQILDTYLKPTKGPIIYVDTRESRSLVDCLERMGAEVHIEQLDIGDFVLSEDIVVERKTVEDYIRSLMDNRLFSQLVAMKNKYPKPLLIVQGSRKKVASIGLPAFYSSLASALTDFYIPIYTSEDDEETAVIIYYIAKREQEEGRKAVRVREGRKPLTTPEIQKYVVAGVPGIDAILADRLLKHFKNVKGVFSASLDELKTVEGIGDKTASKIREVAEFNYCGD
ncbi:MAG: helicase-related protein [Nitrososphaerales archaeon]